VYKKHPLPLLSLNRQKSIKENAGDLSDLLFIFQKLTPLSLKSKDFHVKFIQFKLNQTACI